jgi:hypothetical protein
MLALLEQLTGFDDLKLEISNLKLSSDGISRQLRAWANVLQNSDIRGQRYLTDKDRSRTKAARERGEFLEELKQVRNGKRQG